MVWYSQPITETKRNNMNATQYRKFTAWIIPNGYGDGTAEVKQVKMIGIDKAGVEADIREAYTNISHIEVSEPES